MCYKCIGYSGKTYFWVMPCNVYQVLCVVSSFWPNLSYEASVLLAQVSIGYSGLAIVAVATPDTSDLILFGEKPYFFISHSVLVIFPYLYIWNGQLSMLPSTRNSLSNFKYITTLAKDAIYWWSFTCITFALFYFAIVTPLSIFSGLNLNYMLSPPANQDIVVGNNYRLISIICVALVFLATRLLAITMELVIRAINSFCIHRKVAQKLKKSNWS